MALFGGPAIIVFVGAPAAFGGRFRYYFITIFVSWAFWAFDWWLVQHLLDAGLLANDGGYDNLEPLLGFAANGAATLLSLLAIGVGAVVFATQERCRSEKDLSQTYRDRR